MKFGRSATQPDTLSLKLWQQRNDEAPLLLDGVLNLTQHQRFRVKVYHFVVGDGKLLGDVLNKSHEVVGEVELDQDETTGRLPTSITTTVRLGRNRQNLAKARLNKRTNKSGNQPDYVGRVTPINFTPHQRHSPHQR